MSPLDNILGKGGAGPESSPSPCPGSHRDLMFLYLNTVTASAVGMSAYTAMTTQAMLTSGT